MVALNLYGYRTTGDLVTKKAVHILYMKPYVKKCCLNQFLVPINGISSSMRISCKLKLVSCVDRSVSENRCFSPTAGIHLHLKI